MRSSLELCFLSVEAIKAAQVGLEEVDMAPILAPWHHEIPNVKHGTAFSGVHGGPVQLIRMNRQSAQAGPGHLGTDHLLLCHLFTGFTEACVRMFGAMKSVPRSSPTGLDILRAILLAGLAPDLPNRPVRTDHEVAMKSLYFFPCEPESSWGLSSLIGAKSMTVWPSQYLPNQLKTRPCSNHVPCT